MSEEDKKPEGILSSLGGIVESAAMFRLMEQIRGSIEIGKTLLQLSVERGEESWVDVTKVADTMQALINALELIGTAASDSIYEQVDDQAKAHLGLGSDVDPKAKLYEVAALASGKYRDQVTEILQAARA